jgi:tRNA(Arg) A34 adenosine deaminase TadA
MTDREMLAIALEEARSGLGEGGIPIGAALFTADGTLLGRGRNRRVQEQDPSLHGETDAFRRSGRRRSYRDTVMVTTLAPCWYCSGLVRQFGIPKVVVGESVNFSGGPRRPACSCWPASSPRIRSCGTRTSARNEMRPSFPLLTTIRLPRSPTLGDR